MANNYKIYDSSDYGGEFKDESLANMALNMYKSLWVNADIIESGVYYDDLYRYYYFLIYYRLKENE